MPNYLKLYTPQDSAVVFIDHQPQMTFGVANSGVEYAYTMVHKAPQSAKVPQIVPKKTKAAA